MKARKFYFSFQEVDTDEDINKSAIIRILMYSFHYLFTLLNKISDEHGLKLVSDHLSCPQSE